MLHLGSINPGTSTHAGRMVSSWAALGRSIASRLSEVILDLYSALVRHIWSDGSRSGLPGTKETGTYWNESSKGLQR